ncbi:uncharacterized protein MKZ38_006566 [Zalerion maritima]|uniref:ATP synthase regulation protein NCA2 n=1 Tax=Zalerion maritima TaxID=339359 RepID=A0AAD5RJT9_9PEZI|nr:uncharacterized protein MKZ38_006566 [Zalerion maritima]
MSVIADHIRRIDLNLDRLPWVPSQLKDGDGEPTESALEAMSNPRVSRLMEIAKTLSTTSSSRPLLSPRQIVGLLTESGLAPTTFDNFDASRAGPQPQTEIEAEVEWLIVSKAAIQTQGVLMRTLLDQMMPLSDDIWYWDEVIGSYTYSSLYTVQTSPLRFWAWSKDIYNDSSDRFQRLYQRPGLGAQTGGPVGQPSMMERWRRFYSLVAESIARKSVTDVRRRIMSPVAICRSQARKKRQVLKALRELAASGLGVMTDEGFDFPDDVSESDASSQAEPAWKGLVERSIALMDNVLKEVLFIDHTIPEFEDGVFARVEEDPELSIQIQDPEAVDRPAVSARRLIFILQIELPAYHAKTRELFQENGRPSRLIRYWLPAGAFLLSSTTLLRILVRRKDDLINWTANLGVTVRDFWFNWVVDPVRKVIGTIRHDANSEIAIMSRDSLKADQNSLERMVVEFAKDQPNATVGQSSISDAQLAEIQAKVREGDVTPVLKVYEQELRKPFVGAVKGDLVRSLLIQVQKTKVDLEVALSGIDALLKSQELVFGFVGLTPGLLVSIGLWQYLRNVMGGRKGLSRSRRAGRSVRVLRNIDRIFSDAAHSETAHLGYKDRGLLMCEAHVLRQLAHGLLPGDIEKEFLEDMEELTQLKGIQVQARALQRIRWAYAKWL